MHVCCWKDGEYRKAEKKRFSIISPARYKPKCNSDYVLLIFFLYIYYLPKLFNWFHSLPFLLNIVLKNIPFYVSKKFSKVIFMSAEYVCHNLFNHFLILGILFPKFSFLKWCDENPCIYTFMYVTDYVLRINY